MNSLLSKRILDHCSKMADWSMLPCDVLGEIALKLDQIESFLYFSAVCHSWNHASSLVKSQWNTNTTIMPWMLLAENTNDNPNCLRKVYNLSNNKSYQLKLPETFGGRCWGSLYGWIVIQTYDFQAHLFNPLTKARITSLPSLLTLRRTPFDPLEDQQHYFDNFVHRFVVLKLPQSRHPPNNGDEDDDGSDLLIAAIYGERNYLAFARPGDQAWTHVADVFVGDVMCWRDVIFIVRGTCGRLFYCDGVGGDHLNNKKDVVVLDYNVPKCSYQVINFDKVSLLDLCGDLLMVVQVKNEEIPHDEEISYDEEISDDDEHCPFVTTKIHVYKLDNKIKKWVKIKNIGNFAIFVGNNSSIAIPVSEGKEWMKNCIFFTDNETNCFRSTSGFGGKDMGVYNISSRVITKFYEGDDIRSPICPPIFFVPRIK